MRRQLCSFCNRPAAWRWVTKNPPPNFRLMCDEHAARFDLDELGSLHPLDQAEVAP